MDLSNDGNNRNQEGLVLSAGILELGEALQHEGNECIDIILMLPAPIATGGGVIHALGPRLGNALADGVHIVCNLRQLKK